jgi:hypothetical protein
VLRGGWVDVRRPSTGTGARPGSYLDPLPPQALAAGRSGMLSARARSWSAFVVVVSVPSATAAGRSEADIVVRDAAGGEVARVPFSLTVVHTRDVQGALDPAIAPHDPRNFKVLFNFNPNWYRALAPAKTAQEQYEQSYRTVWMLARHRAATNVWQRAYPSADGTYSCNAADGYLKVFQQMPWWADGRPGAIPVALMPNHTVARCDQPAFTIRDDAAPGTKFDDVVGDATRSAWFIHRVGQHWRSAGLVDHRSYFMNPFDEPSAQQQRTVVPQVNKLVRDYAPGVKILASTWPMEVGSRRVCKRVKGTQRCATRTAQTESNLHLRDGLGGDDLHGWIAPYFRMYGFGVNAAQQQAGISRSREVMSRLKAIQAGGGEAWTYDLPLGSRRVPQLAIDGAASDARLLFWPLGREGTNGWFIAVSNRWINPVNISQTRNPWDDPLSWVGTSSLDKENLGPHGVISNGWGSLYYPALRPELGLNDPLAQPVSSIRLQRMRDGVEDANLMRQYRDRFGQAALNQRLASVLGPLRAGTDLPARETFPAIRNAGAALRMEAVRRQLLMDLAG